MQPAVPPKWNKTDNKTSPSSPGRAWPRSHHPSICCLLPPAKHVVYPTMTANSLRAHGFSTARNGKMWAVGIGYEIAMDAGSCWDRGTLQDSITDSAPRLCSPFIGNQRIFVNLRSNSYGHQSHALEEIARTSQRKSISWANRCRLRHAIWNSYFHLWREPVCVAVVFPSQGGETCCKAMNADLSFLDLQSGAKTNRAWPGWGAFYVTCLWVLVTWVCGSGGFLWGGCCVSPARPSRQQCHSANSDSAVSGNICVRAGKVMGMPHSILHALSTFQFNAAWHIKTATPLFPGVLMKRKQLYHYLY